MISSSGSDDPASGRSLSGGPAPEVPAAVPAPVSGRAPGRATALRPALAVFVGVQVHGLTEWSFGDQEVAVLPWTSLGLAMAVARSGGITDVVRRSP